VCSYYNSMVFTEGSQNGWMHTGLVISRKVVPAFVTLAVGSAGTEN
jgi:hypothetical protein